MASVIGARAHPRIFNKDYVRIKEMSAANDHCVILSEEYNDVWTMGWNCFAQCSPSLWGKDSEMNELHRAHLVSFEEIGIDPKKGRIVGVRASKNETWIRVERERVKMY